MDKKALSERDVCTKFISPAIAKGGWDVQAQVRENVYLTKGRVIVRGKLVSRGTAKFALGLPRAEVALAEVSGICHQELLRCARSYQPFGECF